MSCVAGVHAAWHSAKAESTHTIIIVVIILKPPTSSSSSHTSHIEELSAKFYK
jgi:hypothetical protein